MKAYVVEQPGRGVDAWRSVERETPRPGPGEVLVRVRAVSLNYRDLMVAKGTYGGKIRPGLVPLSDGAGEVAELGAGVTEWRLGDRVCGSFFQTWLGGALKAADHKQALGGSVDGMAAEFVVLKAGGLVEIPPHLSFEEASTLPCAALTAWNALFVASGPLTPGATVLTQGSGGVSTFALLFAKLAGYRVISTSSSEEKLARLRALGADETVDYRRTPRWDEEAWRLTGGVGVDQVIEVGGAGTMPLSFQASKHGGTVSVIGVLTGMSDGINPAQILQRSLRVQGIYVGSVEMFRQMNTAVARAGLRPVIDEVFPFAEAPAALRKMESAAHFGKIVLRL